MFRDIVDCRGRLRSVEKAGTAANDLNLADALRERRVIQCRKPDPVSHDGNPILQYQDKFRFLWVPETAITDVKLAGRLLLSDEETRGLC
jgi:hypothetical protein